MSEEKRAFFQMLEASQSGISEKLGFLPIQKYPALKSLV